MDINFKIYHLWLNTHNITAQFTSNLAQPMGEIIELPNKGDQKAAQEAVTNLLLRKIQFLKADVHQLTVQAQGILDELNTPET